mmetsp:Transcript_44173/g.147314  ORF Transcript_44173/g.147314 Transcript_44173/m.147314 type:complete len:294 (+) Transcript_44173:218-1099(+)
MLRCSRASPPPLGDPARRIAAPSLSHTRMRSHPLLHGLLLQIAVSHTPSPALVTLCQFASCTVLVYGCKQTGLLRTDDFEWVKVKYFLIYVLSFSVGTWTNIKVLQDANVETLIVFRSCTPLAVCIFDFFIYRRAMPSARSCAALLLITAGAMAYIACDREYRNKGVRAYFWASVWWAVLVFQLTYGKFLVTGIPLRWTRSPEITRDHDIASRSAPVHEIGRDRTSSHEITRDRPRSPEIGRCGRRCCTRTRSRSCPRCSWAWPAASSRARDSRRSSCLRSAAAGCCSLAWSG